MFGRPRVPCPLACSRRGPGAGWVRVVRQGGAGVCSPTSSSTPISVEWISRGLGFTALGASEMLERELELTRAVRSGVTPSEAASQVAYRRRARALRGRGCGSSTRLRIRHEGAEEQRAADVELAKIQAAWKVVLVDVKGEVGAGGGRGSAARGRRGDGGRG